MNLKSIKNTVFGNHSLVGLQEQSKSVLSVFQKAMEDLTSINEQAFTEQVNKQQLVDEAMKEIEQLETLRSHNIKVINNIKNIVS